MPAGETDNIKVSEPETQEYGPGFVTEEGSEAETQAQPEVEAQTEPSTEGTDE